jgi:hypothetical protein
MDAGRRATKAASMDASALIASPVPSSEAIFSLIAPEVTLYSSREINSAVRLSRVLHRKSPMIERGNAQRDDRLRSLLVVRQKSGGGLVARRWVSIVWRDMRTVGRQFGFQQVRNE